MTPEQIEAKLNEAHTFYAEGNLQEGKKAVKEVLDVNIKDPRALQLLGMICYEERNFDLARDLFKEALKIDPEQAATWNHLGVVLNDLRQPEEAEKALRKALELNPDLARAYKNLADIYLNQGDKEQGLAFLEKGIETNPDFLGSYLAYAKAAEIPVDDPLVDLIKKQIKKFEGNESGLSFLHYALSYVYQKAGDTKSFFFHLAKANEYSRAKDQSWKDRVALRFKNIRLTTTKEFLSERVSEDFKIYTPIFIVGMPRSGTSLTDQIFATHSQCFGGDELQYFGKYLNRLGKAYVNSSAVIDYPKIPMQGYEQLATLYQKRVQALSPGTQYISDKMPWNYQNIGMIYKTMPWAKIIHIYRDPVDCGFSCYRNPLPTNLEFTCDLEDYAFYRNEYQTLMDFWQETIPDAFINLSYEDMVDNPEKELRRVLEYCGLPWEDSLLEFHKTKRQVRTISSDQVNQPLNKKSIGVGEKYKVELSPMVDALKGYGIIKD